MEMSSLIICVLTVFVLFVQGDQHEKSVITEDYDPYVHKRYQLECIEETRVDPDLVIKIKNGKFQSKPDVLLKLWVLCTMMKSGLMTPQGVYKFDTAMARVPKQDAKFVGSQIDKCLSKKAIPAVDIAYNFVKCYKRKGNYSSVSIA